MATQSFGRYELRGILGEGGFATVYRARAPGLPHDVALKALLPQMATDDSVRDWFQIEFESLAIIRHPNIVEVYEAGEAWGRPFFTMELVDGKTLADLLAYGRGMDLGRVTTIVDSLASALDYLHAVGRVHRDVKAENVMIDRTGRVVLMDLGIVHLLDRAALTGAGLKIGSPPNMAPEQLQGKDVGPAADIYSLGLLTYQLLAGRLPFTGNTQTVIDDQLRKRPPPLRAQRPDLPSNASEAVDAALSKDPRKRPRTAGDFAEALAGRSEALARPPQRPSGYKPEPTERDNDRSASQTSWGGILDRLRGLGARGGATGLALVASDGLRVPLRSGETILGRDPSCQIRLDDSEVSRRHARLLIDADRAEIEDLGSTNGVYVNDLLVSRAWLYPGDRIRMGGITLELDGG